MAQRWRHNIDLTGLSARARDAAGDGLHDALEHVLQVSNSRVPIEEGTLERSGDVDLDRAALRGAVSYDTPYAVRQHEDMTLTHDAGRQAKYLESAFTGERQQVLDIIAARVRRATS